MRRIVLALMLLASPALAQEAPSFLDRLLGTDSAESDAEQGSLLERLIEDSLSDAGRAVTVTGFRGALSGEATLDSLTISDADGTWLTLTDATLDWNRTALLRGRLEVTELSAREILLPRLATPSEPDAPSPEASGFQLPELPVAVNIGRIAAERVELGEPVLGVAAVISMEGALSLDGGDGAADLAITRLDRPGEITLDAGYQNTTGDLRLALSMSEEEGGILATLLGLPGAPSVDFTIEGEAPISDFAADIRLATEGEDRLSGTLTISETEDARRITANIGGDIAPVFAPQYRDFFGNALTLETEALLFRDGRVALPAFTLSARQLILDGTLEIGADKMPDRIDVTGRIAPENGDTVLLPLAGAETRIGRANLSVQYDATQSEDWQIGFRVAELSREDVALESLRLAGTGRLAAGSPPGVSGNVDFDVEGLSAGDGLAEAIGRDLQGTARVNWSGGPVSIDAMRFSGRDLAAAGSAEIDGDTIRATAEVDARRIANFSTLAGRPLSGQATLDVSGQINPLSQAFDLTARGQTTDLAIGDARADAVLAGVARLEASAVRDTGGLRIALTTLESDAASLTGAASLRSGGSTARLEGRLNETSLVIPGLDGPSDIVFSGEEDDARDWTIDTRLTAPAITAAVNGLLSNIYDLPAFQGRIDAESSDLSVLSEVAGRPLSGQIDLTAEGGTNADLSRGLIDATVSGRDISIGDDRIDPLLRGAVALEVEGARTEDRIDITRLVLDGETLDADISGAITALSETPAFEGRISADSSDLSVFSALAGRTLAGSVRLGAEGSATADLTRAEIDATVNGQNIATGDARFDPLLQGDVALRVEGRRDGDRVDIVSLVVESETLDAELGGVVTELSGTPVFEGSLAAESSDLSRLSGMAGRTLGGRLDLTAQGGARADLSDAVIDATASGSDIVTGIAEVDRLLRGPVNLDIDAKRQGDRIDIAALSFNSDALTVETSGGLGADEDRLAIQARLADVAPYVPGFSGALSVDGTVGRTGETLALDVDATGPGGSQARLAGTVAQDFSTADLSVNGSAPLALANQFIAPRSLAGTSRFDLRVSGRPALENVSGQITLAEARLAAPALRTALEDISGRIDLSGGRATLALDSRLESGGRIALEGPVGLAAPNSAALRIGLNRVRVTDPELYETVIDGQISVDGPLAGGASIAGNLALGETNIRIPSSGLGGAGAIPEVTHVNEPPPVRGTRRKAGLLRRGSNGERAGGPVYPLDIRISAPNRLFVRGRGLDSEFGGNLRVTGTTANVVPIGAFELIRGRMDILGRRLALEQARITVQGDFIPFLDIRASTDVEDTEVSVVVIGPADNPEVRFTSSPELPQEEVLARLIFGRGLETLSPLQAARLAIAVRTLAGQGGEGIVGGIRSRAGLADLDVTTNEDGNAAVRAGAYLGENIYSDVTVDSAGETQLNLNLDLTPSLTVRGGLTNEGDTSLGIFFERDY